MPLRGINPILTGHLLKAMSDMGHNDEIVIADGNFPAESLSGKRPPIQAPSADAVEVVCAMLEYFPLDEAEVSVQHIAPEDGQGVTSNDSTPVGRLFWDMMYQGYDRRSIPLGQKQFYERASKAFVIVETIDPRHWGCFILRKGALPDPTT